VSVGQIIAAGFGIAFLLMIFYGVGCDIKRALSKWLGRD
jgi:hypothetical protein